MAFAPHKALHHEPGEEVAAGRKTEFLGFGIDIAQHAGEHRDLQVHGANNLLGDGVILMKGKQLPLDGSVAESLRLFRCGYGRSAGSDASRENPPSPTSGVANGNPLLSGEVIVSLHSKHAKLVETLNEQIIQLQLRVAQTQLERDAIQLHLTEQNGKLDRATATIQSKCDEIEDLGKALAAANSEIAQQMEAIEAEGIARRTSESALATAQRDISSHRAVLKRVQAENDEAMAALSAGHDAAFKAADLHWRSRFATISSELEAAQSRSAIEMASLRSESEAQSIEMQAVIDDSAARKAAAEAQLAVAKHAVTDLTGERDKLRSALAQASEGKVGRLEQETRRAEEALTELTIVKSRVAALEAELRAALDHTSALSNETCLATMAADERVKSERTRAQAAQGACAAMEKELAAAQEAGRVAALTLHRLEDAFAKKSAELASTNDQLSMAKSSLSSATAKGTDLIDNVSTLRLSLSAALSELEEERQRCSTLKAAIEDSSAQSIGVRHSLLSVETRYADAVATIAAMEEDLSRARGRAGKASVDVEYMKERVSKAEKSVAELAASQEEIIRNAVEPTKALCKEAMEAAVAECREKVNHTKAECHAEVESARAHAKSEIEEYRRRVDELLNKYESMKTATEHVVSQARNAVEQAKRDEAEARIRSQQAEQKAVHLQARENALQKALDAASRLGSGGTEAIAAAARSEALWAEAEQKAARAEKRAHDAEADLLIMTAALERLRQDSALTVLLAPLKASTGQPPLKLPPPALPVPPSFGLSSSGNDPLPVQFSPTANPTE